MRRACVCELTSVWGALQPPLSLSLARGRGRNAAPGFECVGSECAAPGGAKRTFLCEFRSWAYMNLNLGTARCVSRGSDLNRPGSCSLFRPGTVRARDKIDHMPDKGNSIFCDMFQRLLNGHECRVPLEASAIVKRSETKQLTAVRSQGGVLLQHVDVTYRQIRPLEPPKKENQSSDKAPPLKPPGRPKTPTPRLT